VDIERDYFLFLGWGRREGKESPDSLGKPLLIESDPMLGAVTPQGFEKDEKPAIPFLKFMAVNSESAAELGYQELPFPVLWDIGLEHPVTSKNKTDFIACLRGTKGGGRTGNHDQGDIWSFLAGIKMGFLQFSRYLIRNATEKQSLIFSRVTGCQLFLSENTETIKPRILKRTRGFIC